MTKETNPVDPSSQKQNLEKQRSRIAWGIAIVVWVFSIIGEIKHPDPYIKDNPFPVLIGLLLGSLIWPAIIGYITYQFLGNSMKDKTKPKN